MELRSQEVRTLAPENDPLKMGMGWKVEDLSKPQIMVESTFGDSHPGSAHLDQFVKEAVQAVNDNGGKAARYLPLICAMASHRVMTASTTLCPIVTPS